MRAAEVKMAMLGKKMVVKLVMCQKYCNGKLPNICINMCTRIHSDPSLTPK